MRIAATDGTGAALSPLLVGPTAIAFASGDESAAAKAVIDAIRPYKIVKITGAVLGDRAIGADQVTTLASLPSRPILQAKLAGAMQAPIATLAGLLGANLRNLGYALAAGPRPEGRRGRLTPSPRSPPTDRRDPPGPRTRHTKEPIRWPFSPRTICSRRSTR